MENRHGLLVDACRDAGRRSCRAGKPALHMIEPRADQPQAITRGADHEEDL